MREDSCGGLFNCGSFEKVYMQEGSRFSFWLIPFKPTDPAISKASMFKCSGSAGDPIMKMSYTFNVYYGLDRALEH